MLETIDCDLLTLVLERDLLWLTGELSLWRASVTGRLRGLWWSGGGLDWVLLRPDFDGDLLFLGGELSRLGKLSNTPVCWLAGFDFDLLALVLDLDFLLETGDVGGLGGG